MAYCRKLLAMSGIHSRRRQRIIWYAFGVVIGAPVMALFSSFAIKVGDAVPRGAPVLSGMPCLPFLPAIYAGDRATGPASAWRLSRRGDYFVEGGAAGKVTAAVAGMIAGMTGQSGRRPAGPGGHQFSWRYIPFWGLLSSTWRC